MSRNVPRSMFMLVLVSAAIGTDALANRGARGPVVIVQPPHSRVRPGIPPVVVVPVVPRAHRRPRPIVVPVYGGPGYAPGYGAGPGYGPGYGGPGYGPAPIPHPTAPPSYGNNLEEATDLLFYEADDLADEVRRSRLHPQIQQTVNNLETSARWLEDCVDQIRMGSRRDNLAAIYQCQNELNQVLNQFQAVEQVLANVSYQFPQIAQEQAEVRAALNQVNYLMNGANPAPIYSVRATGILDNLRFRFVGRDQIDVNRQCMDFGYQNRVQYVRSLVVNGIRHDRNQYMNLAEACTIVAQNVVQGN